MFPGLPSVKDFEMLSRDVQMLAGKIDMLSGKMDQFISAIQENTRVLRMKD